MEGSMLDDSTHVENPLPLPWLCLALALQGTWTANYHIVARYEWRGVKTYRQFSCNEGEWVEGVTTTPYPLFGLDSLSYKSPLGSVIICEGENVQATSSITMEWSCNCSRSR